MYIKNTRLNHHFDISELIIESVNYIITIDLGGTLLSCKNPSPKPASRFSKSSAVRYNGKWSDRIAFVVLTLSEHASEFLVDLIYADSINLLLIVLLYNQEIMLNHIQKFMEEFGTILV